MALTKRTKTIPRGIRNNNPLNIKIGNTWLGERENPDDPIFEQFVNLRYGLRAAFIILRRYIRRYGKNTVVTIVHTWSPDGESIESSYINNVCQFSGLAPDTPIDYADKETMCKLVCAMAHVECGQEINANDVSSAYDMA